MSFDLMVLMDKTDEATQNSWVDKLKNNGIDCNFPDGFIVGTQIEGEVLVQCKLNPPLVSESTGFEDYEFYFDPMEVNKERIAEMLESTDDKRLQEKLKQMKSEILFYSSAGRDDHALIVQCYASASLADASNGVLVDPQEFGAVHENRVYEIAKHHCGHVISNMKNTKAASKVNQIQKSFIAPKESKGMSGTLIILLILLFLGIKSLIMK